jgi:hypothetical protein
LALLALLPHGSGALAFDSMRAQEIAECRSGEISTWGDGTDRSALGTELTFAYNPAGAPAWFAEAQVTTLIERAAAAWSQCGVPARVVAWNSRNPAQKGLVVVQWSETESRGNFGLANFSRATLSMSPAAFDLLKNRNPAHDASETLQMVISHEMGHLFGLMSHSRRCADVLSYYNNGKGEKCFTRMGPYVSGLGEFRASLPTACDIERCRRANGMPPLPGGRLPPPAPNR